LKRRSAKAVGNTSKRAEDRSCGVCRVCDATALCGWRGGLGTTKQRPDRAGVRLEVRRIQGWPTPLFVADRIKEELPQLGADLLNGLHEIYPVVVTRLGKVEGVHAVDRAEADRLWAVLAFAEDLNVSRREGWVPVVARAVPGDRAWAGRLGVWRGYGASLWVRQHDGAEPALRYFPLARLHKAGLDLARRAQALGRRGRNPVLVQEQGIAWLGDECGRTDSLELGVTVVMEDDRLVSVAAANVTRLKT
jgi:hypothetical protein